MPKSRVAPMAAVVVFAAAVWWALGSEDDDGAPSEPVDRGTAPATLGADVLLRGAPDAVVPEPSAPESVVRPAATPGGPPLLVHGRVVDPKQRPVANARVVVNHGEAPLASTATEADGRFRLTVSVLDVPGPVAGRVNATDAEGRVAVGFLYLVAEPLFHQDPDESIDVGTLVLSPAQAVDVLVKAPRVVTGEALLLVQSETGSGMGAPVASVRVPIGEVTRLPPLPEGVCRLAASAEGLGRGVAGARLPRAEEGPVVLELSEEHRLEIEVVDAATQAPVVGARVLVFESVPWPFGNVLCPYAPPPEPPLTDVQGRTLVRGLDAGERLSVSVQAAGYEAPDPFSRNASSQRVPAGTASLRFELDRLRTVRWPIADGERGVPADGTVIRLVRQMHRSGPFPATGRVAGGHLVVEDLSSDGYAFLAFVPDGSVAQVWPPGEGQDPKAITFEATRSLEVLLRDEDGTPFAGVPVSLHVGPYEPPDGRATTNDVGLVRFEGLAPQQANVTAGERGFPFGTNVGTVDLSTGDGRLEATLWREREVVVHLQVAGQPTLTDRVHVLVAGMPLHEMATDPDAGTVRGRWQPYPRDEEVPLQVTCEGFLPAVATIRRADPPPHEVHLDLAAAGRLLVAVDLPEDRRSKLWVQGYDAEKRGWARAQEVTLDASGTGRVDALPAGRYRVVDQYSCLASEPALVEPGADAPTLHLDLSKAAWAKGRIVGPDGEPVPWAGVRMVDGPVDVAQTLYEGGQWQAGDHGQFWFRVPGDRPVTIEATHGVFRAAAEGGRVTLRAPRDDVVLRLEVGATVRLTFDRPIQPVNGTVGIGWKNVRLYRGPVGDAPAYELDAPVEGSSLRFGAFAPGRYTVWVDAYPYVPVVIEDVALGATGETALGPAETSEGARIVLTLLRDPAAKRGSVHLSAFSAAAPRYIRQVQGTDDVLTLSGLGPGTFAVRATTGTPNAFLDETLEIQGGETVERTLDLR